MFKRKLADNLLAWKDSSTRKPLILRGARQVGKTTLVKMFAENFDFFIHLNLDQISDRKIFQDHDTIQSILQILFLKNKISPAKNQKVLIFIDEIQNSPEAIKLLRYFYEEANHLYVIAAGSLLETLLDNKISFPVGRVEYMILRPFSFEEFLMAKEESAALHILKTIPFKHFAHQTLLDLFKEYCLIGGMPEVVKHYLEHKDIVAVGKIFDNLITAYLDDVEKYAATANQTRIIRHIISNSMKMAGERITFEGFAGSNYKSKDIAECFRILEKTYLVVLVYPTTNTTIPIIENIRKAPKLGILDTGILNYFAGVQLTILSTSLIDNLYEGKIAEHLVGQELLALKSSVLAKNNFWIKEKKQSNAELDFVFPVNDMLIPVEVKLGKTGRLRSLMEYMDLCPHSFAVRVYSGDLNIQVTETINHKTFKLLNLPFYLIGMMPEYIAILINGNDKELVVS